MEEPNERGRKEKRSLGRGDVVKEEIEAFPTSLVHLIIYIVVIERRKETLVREKEWKEIGEIEKEETLTYILQQPREREREAARI